MMYPTPQKQPARKRHTGRNILIGLGVIVVLVIALAAIGAAAGGGKTHSPPAAASTYKTPSLATAPTPAPAASPNGTYQGSCNYDLGNNPAGSPGTAVATGDIQVTNTGNVGEVERMVITWPQQGYSPLRAAKTIHLAFGATRDIEFHYPLTYDQISNLQNWQEGHNYDDGCTYSVTEMRTFGSVNG